MWGMCDSQCMKTPAIGPSKAKAIHMVYEPGLLKEIEDYRYRNRFPTRVEAIKALLKAGLTSEKKEKGSNGKAG